MKRFTPVVALGLLALVAQPPWAQAERVLRYGISHGRHPADHRPARPRRRRLPVHRLHASTTRWSPGRWTSPTGRAS